MKISRLKKVQRFLSFFRNSYGFRQPYQVLIDGTFCVAAKTNKVNIADQLPKYLGGPVKLLTTQCVIVETEKLGKELYGALVIIKQFKHHRCGHESKPVPAYQCLKEMIGVKNTNRYIIATQDWELQKAAGSIPGVPVLYLHEQTPTLQPPSEASTRMANLRNRERFEVNTVQKEALIENRKRLGIEEEIKPEKKKKRKISGPNPLSCKKKKKKKKPFQDHPQQDSNTETVDSVLKTRKRKRIKIAQHVKEHLRETLTNADRST